MPVYFSQRNLTGRHSVHHSQHYTKFRKKVNIFLFLHFYRGIQSSTERLSREKETKNLTNIYKYVKIEST